MVTPRVMPSKVFKPEDPLPNPPLYTFPQAGGLYYAPLRFTGKSSYYGSGYPAIVVGIVHPGEDREQKLSNADEDYDFSLAVNPGPAVVKLYHGFMGDGYTHEDIYLFNVYILTPPS